MAFPSKLCITSHVLPPSPSGQAMVLHRLLSNQPTLNYCLVSTENNELPGRTDATTRLNALHYQLAQVPSPPLVHRIESENIKILLDGLHRIYRLSLQICRIVKQEKCTAILGCSGNPFDLPAAYLASIFAKVPLISYMFDDYLYQWAGGPYQTLSRLFARRIMKSSVDVIVPNERLQREYNVRYGIRPTVIHNPCVIADFARIDNKTERKHLELDPSYVNIVYTGSVYHAHYDAFRNLLKALDLTDRSNIRLHIYTAQSESQLKTAGLTGKQLQLHEHVPSADIPSILHQADILFLPLAFESTITEVIRTSAPGKTGEYLATGKPILVHAPRDSFLSDYFSTNCCGVVVDDNDPLILSAALLRILDDQVLRDNVCANARSQAIKDFDLEKVQQNFFAIVTKMRSKKIE